MQEHAPNDLEGNIERPVMPVRRSERQSKPPGEWWKAKGLAARVQPFDFDPETFEQAMASSQADKWRQAIDEEMESLYQNNTFTTVQLPPGAKAIPLK